MRDYNHGIRKAAILLASLDPQSARSLLDGMSPAQADAVRAAADCLGEIDPVEQNEVIDEFFRIGPLVPDKQPTGIELCRALPCAATPAAESGAALASLCETPPPVLATFLKREHPQTIAVVVSNLPPQHAAEVLAVMSAEMQVEVARRLVDLDETDPECLREVRQGLENWLQEQARLEGRRGAGMAALQGILSAATPRARQHILANLARHDRELAGNLQVAPQRPAAFSDLEALDTATLVATLRRADPELLALALAGARPEFAERCLALLASHESQPLRRALCKMGPTRLSDIEAAQQALAEQARQFTEGFESPNDTRTRLSVAA
jgi:flagellar motor switch protein FliG